MSESTFIRWSALGSLAFGGVVILLLATNANKNGVSRECPDETKAFALSTELVKDALKAPATAQFPSLQDRGVVVDNRGHFKKKCRYAITAFVDSQNGFGAVLRTQYSVTMLRRDSGRWDAERLVLD